MAYDEGFEAASDDEAPASSRGPQPGWARLAYHIEDESGELALAPTADRVLPRGAVDTEGGIVPGVKMMRLIVGKKCRFCCGQTFGQLERLVAIALKVFW